MTHPPSPDAGAAAGPATGAHPAQAANTAHKITEADATHRAMTMSGGHGSAPAPGAPSAGAPRAAPAFPVPWSLAGKVALVTGAGSGLGRHFARTLARAGARVVVAGRRREALADTVAAIAAEGGAAFPLVLDVTEAAAVGAAFATIEALAGGPLAILVNNAGVAVNTPAIDLDPDDFARVVDTNLTGAFLAAQAAARLMRGSGGGSIINIASILGLRVAGAVAPYTAAKAGLIQLTKALALEWARHGIRVNALAPGYVETDLNADFFASEAGQRLIARIPQRRLAKLADLDGPLLLLASEASAHMTGSVLAVDGGHLASSL